MLYNSIKPQSFVTHLDRKNCGGRLGDMLIMYAKAKWLSHHYKLPFLYTPFNYSDQLKMHYKENHYKDSVLRNKHTKRMVFRDDSLFDFDTLLTDDMLYVVHYYFSPLNWGDYQRKYDSQEVMGWAGVWDNQDFLNELKDTIAPIEPIVFSDLPKDTITVAVHIRNGGGFDSPLISRQLYNIDELNPMEVPPTDVYADWYWPLKFPPVQYYVDQIKRLSEMCDDTGMYVHIYTDSADPLGLQKSIELAVNKKNISFHCRQKDNCHNQNVLEDMFDIARYDCLIRSGSNYPQISQLIGNHRIVIYPREAQWIGNTIIINDVGIFVR